jgi:hypothetical protein
MKSLQLHWRRSHMALAAVMAFLSVGVPARLHAEDNRAPEVPADIQVEAGHKVHFHAYAEGVQIYTWNGSSWGTSVPEATLYDNERNVVGVHYGTPNGPAWESVSGSKVIATVAAPRVTVDTNAIPWLLLRATYTQGPGVFASTAFIQRVNTTGGKAPQEAGTTVGQVAPVPYTADYYFFREE